jgi:isopentenyldiphosphate isomerase
MVPDPLRVTGALVVDGDGRIFFQRRSPTRKLFPNSWTSSAVTSNRAKRSPFRWLGPDELAVLDESGEPGDGMIRRIAEDGFAVLHTHGM